MTKKRVSRREVVAEELADVDLGDSRRTARGKAVADRMAAAPEASLPVAMKDRAMLEALYRHLSSEGVDFQGILGSHLARSGGRVAGASTDVYVAHDTTACTFSGEAERDGVGVVNGEQQGFFAHVSLAVAADGKRTPLGLLAAEIFTREGAQDLEDSEAKRWNRGVSASAARTGGCGRLVHVADREGDAYGLLAELSTKGHRFIIRAKGNRVIDLEGAGRTHLFDAAQETRHTYALDVPVAKRGGKRHGAARQAHPDRDARLANLTFAALAVTLRRPTKNAPPGAPARLAVNAVHILEVGAPVGEKPIEWLLLTSEPIDTKEQIAAVVEGYRTRWTVEEYFKALKTGCAFEERQLESFRSLTNLLAYSLIIAYALLLLRALARSKVDLPADALLTSDQLVCLGVMTKRKKKALATATQVLDAIAELGVHLKSNGLPGWRVLSRGWQRLLDFEAAYQAMKAAGLVINR
jgi:Transposase DNA-binding/Transposase DDE domain